MPKGIRSFVAISALLLASCGQSPITQRAESDSATSRTNNTVNGSSDSRQGRLAQVLDREMIGADLAHFEQVAGPARVTDGDRKTYKINGCEVTATVGGGSVMSLHVDLSPECTFEMNDIFLDSGLPPAHAMTFGMFDAFLNGGRFYADCLTDCGNAYEPSVYAHFTSPRAYGFLEVMLEVVLADDEPILASNIWQDAMRKQESDEWIREGNFNCTEKWDAVARKAFHDITITGIAIGRELQLTSCE